MLDTNSAVARSGTKELSETINDKHDEYESRKTLKIVIKRAQLTGSIHAARGGTLPFLYR